MSSYEIFPSFLVYVISYLFHQICSFHNNRDPHQFPLFYEIGQIFQNTQKPQKGDLKNKKIRNIS